MIVLVMLHLHHSVERSAFLRIQFSFLTKLSVHTSAQVGN